MEIQPEDIEGDPTQPTLSVPLEPSQPRGNRIVGTCLLTVFMGGATAALVYAYYRTPIPDFDARLVAAAWIVPIGIFGLLAVLLFWSALRQILAVSVPMTLVEIDRHPVMPGDSVVVCVKQPGAARLKSIRVNVLGTQRTEQWDTTPGRTRLLRSTTNSFFQKNILDADGGWIRSGTYRQWLCPLEIPGDANPSGKSETVITSWTIELWGVGDLGLVGFFYQFPLKVVAHGVIDEPPAISITNGENSS